MPINSRPSASRHTHRLPPLPQGQETRSPHQSPPHPHAFGSHYKVCIKSPDKSPRVPRPSGVVAPGLAVNGRNNMNSHDLPLTAEDMTGEAVGQYLRAHPEFLESWLMEQVELETLERWMIRRTQRDKQKSLENDTNGKIIRKTSLSRWKFCVHADKRKMLQELTSSLYVRPNKPHVLWELTRCISSAVNADGCNLYLADLDTNTLRRYVESKDGRHTV